jgi:hypothetical protein
MRTLLGPLGPLERADLTHWINHWSFKKSCPQSPEQSLGPLERTNLNFLSLHTL